jgi:hypothetical protein
VTLEDIEREIAQLRSELAAEREPAVRGRLRQAVHDLEDERRERFGLRRAGPF